MVTGKSKDWLKVWNFHSFGRGLVHIFVVVYQSKRSSNYSGSSNTSSGSGGFGQSSDYNKILAKNIVSEMESHTYS